MGHATRHRKIKLIKMATVLLNKIKGNRKRGTPSMSYISNLTNIIEMNIDELIGKRDRDELRKVVNSIAVTIEPSLHP